MSWNHRIMRRAWHCELENGYKESGVEFGVHEVHYNSKGQVVAWSEEPRGVSCDSVAELRDMLNLMQSAFDKPVLDYDMTPEGNFDSDGETNAKT